jgi:hypothetical protein
MLLAAVYFFTRGNKSYLTGASLLSLVTSEEKRRSIYDSNESPWICKDAKGFLDSGGDVVFFANDYCYSHLALNLRDANWCKYVRLVEAGSCVEKVAIATKDQKQCDIISSVKGYSMDSAAMRNQQDALAHCYLMVSKAQQQ